MYSENCSDCAASSPGLFPAFGAPASPGAGLFGQTGASPSNAFGGRSSTHQVCQCIACNVSLAYLQYLKHHLLYWQFLLLVILLLLRQQCMHGTGVNLFGSSSSSQSAFPALSQPQSGIQLFSGFGQTPAANPFGQATAPSSSSSSAPWTAASSASGVASTFGSFGFGQSSSAASQGGSSGSAASPFGKGLSFGSLSSPSAAAAAPTSSSGGVGGFEQQGFAASQPSGVTTLLLFIWNSKFTMTVMYKTSSLQHTDKVCHYSSVNESSEMHACRCCNVSLHLHACAWLCHHSIHLYLLYFRV